MVKSLLSILSKKQSNILSGAIILMLAVFVSKVLGLVRNRLLVHNFNSAESARFLAAFSLPDLLFQLLIFGALSVAFIPVFTDFLNKNKHEAFEFASSILNLSLLTFSLFAVLAFIFTPQINNLLIPGFKGEQKIITDQMTQIILVGQFFLVVGAFFIGIGQSFQRFIISSLAPVVYNLGIILGIIFLTPYFGILGPAYGVILGAILHVLIQFPLVYSLGFRFNLRLDFRNSGVKEIIKLMSVRNIGLVFEQLSDRVAIALASLISYPSVTFLTFAQQLFVVPITLFGSTIAQATLPVLSKEHSANEMGNFKVTLLTTMHQILFLTLPSAAILIVLRIPVVRLVFGASQFRWEDTVLTGRTVAFLSLGLVSQALVLLLVRAFYALKDTKTPVLVSIVSVVINILLSLVFVQVYKLGVWGLGLSYAISTNLSFLLLLFYLNKKMEGFNKRNLFVPALKMLIAAIISAAALYIPIKVLDQLVFDTTKTINLTILTVIASFFGLSVYIFLVWFMKIKELYTFVDLLKKIYGMGSRVRSKEIVGETEPV